MRWLPVVLLVSFAPAEARALSDHPVIVSPGYLHSFNKGHWPASGNGVELSTIVGTETSGSRAGAGIGALFQLESLAGDSGRSTRWMLGAQASVLGLGVELGYASRSADDRYEAASGVHAGLFASIGIFTIAHRWTIPFRSERREDHGFVIGLKIPFAVKGSIRDFIEIPYGGPITFGN
jgi:hypothetical protein